MKNFLQLCLIFTTFGFFLLYSWGSPTMRMLDFLSLPSVFNIIFLIYSLLYLYPVFCISILNMPSETIFWFFEAKITKIGRRYRKNIYHYNDSNNLLLIEAERNINKYTEDLNNTINQFNLTFIEYYVYKQKNTHLFQIHMEHSPSKTYEESKQVKKLKRI